MVAQRSIFAGLAVVVVIFLCLDQCNCTVRVIGVLMLASPVCVLSAEVFNVNNFTETGNESVVYEVTVYRDGQSSANVLRLF